MTAFFSNDRLKPPDLRTAALVAMAAACALAPPRILHQAVAATAGTLFEAAPFVLAVALVRRPVTKTAAALIGCGCGGAAGVAALSLPAAALCWTVFGPWVAAARFAAAVALHRLHHRTGHRDETDLLGQLSDIAVAAFALAAGTAVLLDAHGLRPPGSQPSSGAKAAQFAAGLFAGAIAPCSTAAVALAAMVRGPGPFAAAGILATAGLVPGVRLPRRTDRPGTDARLGLVLVGIASGLLAFRGGAGFVHPRLVPFLWVAVAASLVAARARPVTRCHLPLAAPVLMVLGLLTGSPPPATGAAATMLDDLYPGESVSLTGRAAVAGGRVSVVQFAITCCRADATAVEAPTDLPPSVADGAWFALVGTIARGPNGDYIRVRSSRRVPPPADPFVYR